MQEIEHVIGTLSELSEYMGISRKTAWKRVKNGQLPQPIMTDSGKRIGWTADYINEWQKILKERAIRKLAATYK
jgi:predicted DNA-binding transcriptional regulator AlpA